MHPPTKAIQRPYRVSAEMAKRTPGNRTYDTTDDGVGPMVQNIAATSFIARDRSQVEFDAGNGYDINIVRRGDGAAIVLISQNLFIVQFSENVL